MHVKKIYENAWYCIFNSIFAHTYIPLDTHVLPKKELWICIPIFHLPSNVLKIVIEDDCFKSPKDWHCICFS